MRLKEWAHRNKAITIVAAAMRDRQRNKRFQIHLRDTVGVAASWTSPEQAIESGRAQLAPLLAATPSTVRKGIPAVSPFLADDFDRLRRTFDRGSARIDASDVQAAARIASFDPANPSGFRLWLAAFFTENFDVISELRRAVTAPVVLHMTCVARLARALESGASFAGHTAGATHVYLTGNGRSFEFDPGEGRLEVPAADTYESLPLKLFSAIAILTLAADPLALLKVDDDHRLGDSSELSRLFDFTTASVEPIQVGHRIHAPQFGAHHRGWHLGKGLRDTPLEMPLPAEWADGAAGYLLNRSALWRVLWAYLYYRHWLGEILYEDMAVGEVAGKTGILVVQGPLLSAVSTSSDY